MIHDLYLRAHIVVSRRSERAGRRICEALAFTQAVARLRPCLGYGDNA